MRNSMTGMALGLTVSILPLATSAIAASPFDGVYGGQQKTTISDNRGTCVNLDREVRLSVVNNTISYPWGRFTLTATVGSDGSFYTEQLGLQTRALHNATNQLKGRINLGTLEADVGGNVCAVHLSLRKM